MGSLSIWKMQVELNEWKSNINFTRNIDSSWTDRKKVILYCAIYILNRLCITKLIFVLHYITLRRYSSASNDVIWQQSCIICLRQYLSESNYILLFVTEFTLGRGSCCSIFSFCVMFYRSLFVLSLLATVLSILLSFTASVYPFGIIAMLFTENG